MADGQKHQCPVCGRPVEVNSLGLIGKHDGAVPKLGDCPGTGRYIYAGMKGKRECK